MQEEKEGFTVGEFFKIIFSRKWLALAVAVVITVAGTLALYYGYSRGFKYYVGNFSLMFPYGDSITMKYPDGTAFNYRDMTSLQNLREIKELDESFANLDVEDMLLKGAVSVERVDEKESVSEQKYELRVKASYFSNKEQAQKFIGCIINTPVRYLQSLASDLSMFLVSYGETDFYEEKVDLLLQRVDYLKEISVMMSGSGGTLGKACKVLESRLARYLDSLNGTILKMRGEGEDSDTAETHEMIVHNAEEVKTRYAQLIKSLDDELKIQKKEWDMLSSVQGELNGTVSSHMAELAKSIARNEYKKELYARYLNDGATLKADPAFADELDAHKLQLEEITREFESNLGKSSSGTFVVYGGTLGEEGSISLASSLLISFVAGIILGALTAFFVGYAAYKKNGKGGKPSAAAEDNDGGKSGEEQ